MKDHKSALKPPDVSKEKSKPDADKAVQEVALLISAEITSLYRILS